MKYIVCTLFLLSFLKVVGQQNILPGSPHYDRLKEEDKIQQPAAAPKQKNYPKLLSAAPAMQEASGNTTPMARMMTASATEPCMVEDPSNDPSFSVMAPEDDGSTQAISLPFTFNFFGINYQQLYVNINGNVTFDAPNGVYNATGFPSSYDMIAPFWADVDTRGLFSGQIYYKTEPHRFTAIWHQVGYYQRKTNKRNTFKLIITDGSDPGIGLGNNIAFYYGDMQWTTGDASGGANGFGGTPATVGMDNGKGEGACFFYQLGRFFKPGTELIDPYTPGGVDYLDNKCFYFDASTIREITFDFNYTKLLCAIDFEPKVVNPQNCQIYTYWWEFGDGTISEEWHPIHSYNAPGTYTVVFNVYYGCGACSNDPAMIQKQITINASEDALMDTVIQVTSQLRQEVITTSAASFSDSWSLQHTAPSLEGKHGFLAGSQGVWRNDGNYVYETARAMSNEPDLEKDGTFSMNSFNWGHAELNAVPNWIHVNAATQYSPYSYETESRDVQGVYSAALYDYGGHLPTANGSNMRNREMAFTGFEYLKSESSGNWIFSTQPIPQYAIYPTRLSYKNIAVVEASVQELENVTHVDVTGKSFFIFTRTRTRTILNNEVVCIRQHPQRPDWSLIVLRQPLFSSVWIGEVKINNQVQPATVPDIDSTFAHTGRSSLRISADRTFKQNLLQLDSGKSYLINAWASAKNPHVAKPLIADNVAIEVIFRDKQNIVLSTATCTPTGSVIEGWQQVKGIFQCPARGATVELKFKPGAAATIWFDDLRLHPTLGNMKTYVYDLNDYRLRAILDEENFADLFFYDKEGALYLKQQETEDGIKTISENIVYQVEN